MKLKFLTVLSLTALIGAAGCRSASNTNTANTTTNGGNTTVTTSTPMTTATPAATATTAAADPAVRAVVEDALKKKGITGVTVDATTAGVTLRGTVAKGKMAEAVQVAQEAAKKPVKNEMTEAK